MRAPQVIDIDRSVQLSLHHGQKLAKAARRHGGTSELISQAELFQQSYVGAGGICLPLSVLWLLGKRTHQSEVARARQALSSRDAANHYVLETQNVTESRLAREGLTRSSTREFHHRLFRLRIAAQFITAHAGYHLIKTPNHAMAAVSRAGEYWFFDPNLGEAVFTNSAAFHGFFEEWMSRQSIQGFYRGKKVRGDVEVDHNTLHLTVEHYA